jgi:hypothetical protein
MSGVLADFANPIHIPGAPMGRPPGAGILPSRQSSAIGAPIRSVAVALGSLGDHRPGWLHATNLVKCSARIAFSKASQIHTVIASAREKAMRYLVFALAFVCAAAAPTHAQDAIPDLKGTWSGKGKSIVFGSHEHHPGSQTATDPPVCATSRPLTSWRDKMAGLLGAAPHPRWPIRKSRSPGRLRVITRPSSERTWTAISASRSLAPTGWRSATPTTARARVGRSSRPATRWIV